MGKQTTHFINLRSIHTFPNPRIAFKFLSIHLPFCQEANLPQNNMKSESNFQSWKRHRLIGGHTTCTGFSTFRCARNSLFTYSSPNNRISLGKCFRWARRRRLYNGMGGRRAIGAGLKPLVVPTAVGVAMSKRGCTFILNKMLCYALCSTKKLGSKIVDVARH